MKDEWPTITHRGATYRVCRAKSYMLSKCFYCSFNCDVVTGCANALPKFLRCSDGIYFKRVKDA